MDRKKEQGTLIGKLDFGTQIRGVLVVKRSTTLLTKTPPTDRHNKAMAAILRRFLNMTKAATAPIPRDGALDTEALNQMRMETETNALVRENYQYFCPFACLLFFFFFSLLLNFIPNVPKTKDYRDPEPPRHHAGDQGALDQGPPAQARRGRRAAGRAGRKGHARAGALQRAHGAAHGGPEARRRGQGAR
jgi:hypothetical protein